MGAPWCQGSGSAGQLPVPPCAPDSSGSRPTPSPRVPCRHFARLGELHRDCKAAQDLWRKFQAALWSGRLDPKVLSSVDGAARGLNPFHGPPDSARCGRLPESKGPFDGGRCCFLLPHQVLCIAWGTGGSISHSVDGLNSFQDVRDERGRVQRSSAPFGTLHQLEDHRQASPAVLLRLQPRRKHTGPGAPVLTSAVVTMQARRLPRRGRLRTASAHVWCTWWCTCRAGPPQVACCQSVVDLRAQVRIPPPTASSKGRREFCMASENRLALQPHSSGSVPLTQHRRHRLIAQAVHLGRSREGRHHR